MNKLRLNLILRVTTQRGMRLIMNPYLFYRFKSNDKHLQHRRLNIEMFRDILTSSIRFSKGNKYDYIDTILFRWTGAYPIR